MASNQQPYGYPPPPPPPPAAQSGAPQNGYPPYNAQQNNYNQPHHQSNGRGRGGRGRGGSFNHAGRGDFHSSAQYNPQAGGYNAPGGYGAPAAVNGGYGTQNSASYGPQPPASSYPSAPPPPQWQHEPQHHQQQPQTQIAPPPIPLSTGNYHPNYAPQVYTSQATVYGQSQQQNSQQQPPLHQQQPQFSNSPQPQNSFAHPPQQPPLPGGPPPPQQQWGGPSQHHSQAPQFNGGRGGRGRGGSNQGRGGFDAPLMGPPIRMGFDDHSSQASNNGFPPFAASQHGSPPVNISSPSYQNNQQGYRTPDYSQRGRGGQRGGYRAPFDSYGNNSRGGREGFSNQRGNFSSRGNRGDMHSNGFKPRYNNSRDFRNFSDNRSTDSDLPSKITSLGMMSDGKKKKQKKKRKTNTLGLTPGVGDQDSDTEDDADEEARLGPLVMGAALMPSDLQVWLAERKRRWPTAAIREAKAIELAHRREQAREQSMRDKAKAQKDRDELAAIQAKLAEAQKANKESRKSKKRAGETKLERAQRKAEQLRKQLEKAEKKVQNSLQAGTKRKRDVGDEGDDSIKLEPGQDKMMAQADDDSSSDDSSSTDSDADSDDSEPEPQSSHQRGGDWGFKPHPLLHTKPCKYFSSGGTCGKQNKCRFIHDQAARDASLKERARDGGRVSLAELLLQNEQDKENLTVLKAIQYMAENGLLDEPQQPSSSAAGQNVDENVGSATMDSGVPVKGGASDNDSKADNYHEAMTDT